jgi:hypothetical protein
MDDRPGEHLQEEPQSERGEPGSRGEGPAPGEGPADRPIDTPASLRDWTGVDPQGPADPDMPDTPPGDQGG